MNLTCDACGRIGNEDDAIEPGGPCQEPCAGTVRLVEPIHMLYETLGSVQHISIDDDYFEFANGLIQDYDVANRLIDRFAEMKVGDTLLRNYDDAEYIERWTREKGPCERARQLGRRQGRRRGR